MPFTPPTPEQIKAAFPNVTSVTFLKQGGFKAVYKIESNGKAEAFKAVHLPRIADPDTANQVKSTIEEGHALNITATPTTFVNNRRVVGPDRNILEQDIMFRLNP